MSTRAHIEVKSDKEKILLYHHFDGYPEWLVPELIYKAFKLMTEDLTPSTEHLRYRPGSVALYFAEAHFQNIRGLNRKYEGRFSKDPISIGFEICNHGLHSDIEWFYLIHLEKIPRAWLTEVFRPNDKYWEAKALPKYISEAMDFLEKKGNLLIDRDGIEYLGRMPKPGDVYKRELEDIDGNKFIEELEVLETGDWLIKGMLKRKRGDDIETELVELSPFSLPGDP